MKFFGLKRGFIALALSISWTLVHGDTTFAQTPSFEFHEGRFRCYFAREALETLASTDESQIKSTIDASMQKTQKALKEETLERDDRKSLQTHLKLLGSLQKGLSPKTKLQAFYQNFCLGSETAIRSSGKGIAHAANVTNQTITFPFRMVFHFARGLFTGEETPRSQFTWNAVLGHRMASTFSMYLLYRGYQALLAQNPATAALYATPMIDTLTLRVCDRKKELNEEDQRFCENYLKTKEAFFNAAAHGQKWGAKLKNRKDDSASTTKEPGNTWNQPVNNDNVCDYIQSVKAGWENGPELRYGAIKYSLMMNPGSYAHPESHPIQMDESLIRKSSATEIAKLRNVVVSLGSNDLSTQLKSEFYLEQKRKLRQWARDYKKLEHENTVENCNAIKNKIKFNFEERMHIEKEISKTLSSETLYQERIHDEGAVIRNAFVDDGSRLRLNIRTKLQWERVGINSVNQLRKLLQDPTVGNIMFVGHNRSRSVSPKELSKEDFEALTKINNIVTNCKVEKKLCISEIKDIFFNNKDLENIINDSQENVDNKLVKIKITINRLLREDSIIDGTGMIFPADIFKKIHPNLMSLSFLICHSYSIGKNYKINEALTNGQSIHQKRILNTLDFNIELDDPEETPIAGFVDYLQRVDRTLYETKQENMLAQEFVHAPAQTKQNNCNLSTPDFDVNQGILALKLNDELIGTYNTREPNQTYAFDCALLQSAKGSINTLRWYMPDTLFDNQIELKNSIPTRFLLNGKEFKAEHVTSWKSFNDLQGNYSGTTVKFRGEL